MSNTDIARWTATVLLILGGISAVILLLQATFGRDKFVSRANTNTLWGIFIVGIAGGLVILWFFK